MSSRRHVDEEDLLRLADGELKPWHARRVQRHMEQCWSCRSRYEQVQSTIRDFVDYRKRVLAPHLPLGESARNRFLRRLDELSRETGQPWSFRVIQFFRSATTAPTNPIFTTFLIVAVAAVVIFAVWQRNAPRVSADELLERAQTWDSASAGPQRQGVIRERVEIRTRTVTLEQSLYRDTEGRRHPRKTGASLQQVALQRAFKAGQVDWQWPLSASDFRKWNDHLSDKQEQVFSNQGGLLTLRTRTRSSEVEEESITVRNADFHPVSRRLVVRDLGEIDISELNYDVLSWDKVNAGELFEPELNVSVPSAVSPTLRKPVMALVPPQAVLDEAELRARLALNQIGADTAEDISISQTASSISITGFVETEPRKRQLDEALAGIPLLKVSISTFELRDEQPPTSEPTQPSHIREQTMTADSSPLELFLVGRSVSPQRAVALSRDLFDEALEIDRQALVLDSLEKRFPSSAQNVLSPGNRSMFQELFERHRSALNAALGKEDELIGTYLEGRSRAETAESTAGSEPKAAADLLRFAADNRRLAGELLAHGRDGQRPGDVILTELAESLQRCERIARFLEP